MTSGNQQAMASEIAGAIPDTHSLLTPDDVARHLKVTTEQVRSLIRKGELAAINVGVGSKRPLYRITQQAVQEFCSKRYQGGPAVHPRLLKQLPPARDHFPGLR